ncbi:MAG: hypothetical protein WKG06_24420 [Segetibacter sp.]
MTGDFNGWNRTSHKLERNDKGDWEIFLPYTEYKDTFVHGSKVKVNVQGNNGSNDRIPAYIRKVTQDQNTWTFQGNYGSLTNRFNGLTRTLALLKTFNNLSFMNVMLEWRRSVKALEPTVNLQIKYYQE